VFHKPQVRTLGEKTYLVGQTVTLPGVTDDELFSETAEWVCQEDIRRMGEMDSDSTLHRIQELAEQQRVAREKLAAAAK
jgi:hypothetical protein